MHGVGFPILCQANKLCLLTLSTWRMGSCDPNNSTASPESLELEMLGRRIPGLPSRLDLPLEELSLTHVHGWNCLPIPHYGNSGLGFWHTTHSALLLLRAEPKPRKCIASDLRPDTTISDYDLDSLE